MRYGRLACCGDAAAGRNDTPALAARCLIDWPVKREGVLMLFRSWFLLMFFAAAIAPISASAADTVDHYAGRDMIVHVPARLPASGSRALVVVLHGGMGNADRIANR